MDAAEVLKYLPMPVATSTEPGEEYGMQCEAIRKARNAVMILDIINYGSCETCGYFIKSEYNLSCSDLNIPIPSETWFCKNYIPKKELNREQVIKLLEKLAKNGAIYQKFGYEYAQALDAAIEDMKSIDKAEKGETYDS